MLVVSDGYTCTLFVNRMAVPQLVLYTPSRKATFNRVKAHSTLAVNLYFLECELDEREIDMLKRAVQGHENVEPIRLLKRTGKVLFTWALDIDKKHVDIWKIVDDLDRKIGVTAVLETAKGYHVYLSIIERSPEKVIRQVYKIEKTYGDVGHVRLAVKRERRRTLTWGVIRVRGKYQTHDIEVLYACPKFNKVYDMWLTYVLDLASGHDSII